MGWHREWRAINARVERFRRLCHCRSQPVIQQNIGSVLIGVIVLRARTNRLSDLKRILPDLIAAIEFAKPGVARFIGLV
jgi:hypothetical protein